MLKLFKKQRGNPRLIAHSQDLNFVPWAVNPISIQLRRSAPSYLESRMSIDKEILFQAVSCTQLSLVVYEGLVPGCSYVLFIG